MSPRVLVAALAGLLAVVATVAVLADRRTTVRVLVASRPIAAGEELVDSVEVRTVPSSGLDGMLVGPGDVTVGVRAARLIAVGEPILRSSLTSGVARARVVSIPIARDRAAGGDLVAGDVVDVIDFSQTPARFVASGLRVAAVAPRASSSVGLDAGSTGSWWVSVEVTAEQALAVSDALGRSKLLLVRSTGLPPVVTGGG